MRSPLAIRRSRRWWAVSVVAHVAIIAALTQIAFKYPLGQLLGRVQRDDSQEKLLYIAVPKPPTETSGGHRVQPSSPGGAPAALPRPSAVPSRLPPIAPLDSARSVAAGGTGSGFDATGSGMATGVVPRFPDARIQLSPGPLVHTPRTTAEDVDSIIGLVVGIANDSLVALAKANKVPEWLVKTKLGTFGLTKDYIQLGKIKIPTALLALTALNAPGAVDPIEARRLTWIRNDIMANAQRSVSEDEFRDAIKRIRERKDRERRERETKPIP